jgi:hypothetical protein
MNIFNNELLENKDFLNDLLNNTKNFIKLNLDLQTQFKETLINYMQRISDCSNEYFNDNYVDSFLDFLNNLKKNLELCNSNIKKLNIMQNSFNKICNSPNNKIISNFYISNIKVQNEILENNIQIENFFNVTVDFIHFYFFTDTTDVVDTICELDSNSCNTTNNVTDNDNNINNTNNENTLFISEMRGKVILPYSMLELEDTLKNNPDKYSSIQDIIDKDYTLPFSTYKNHSISRFKEAFKLMRNKEKNSVVDSFNLGMELLLNYNLHPAIITACKNLNELNIYLDCIKNNETDKFDCFNIVFEMTPVVAHQ